MNLLGLHWTKFRDAVLALTGLVFIAGSIFYALRDDPNSHGDWLVHYGEGFTRRGLLGEVALSLFETTRMSPRFSVVAIQIVVFTLLLLVIRNSFLSTQTPMSLFLLFTPGGLLYMFAEPSVAGRKEYLFLLAVALSIAWTRGNHQVRWRWIVLSLLWLIVFLSHESSILFFPGVFVAMWFLANRTERLHLPVNGLLLGPLAVWLVASPVLLLASSSERSISLCGRVIAAGYSDRVCDGALGYMDQSVSDLTTMAMSAISREDSPIYLFFLVLAVILFAICYGKSGLIQAGLILSVLSLLTGLTLLALIASDWGRWLHMFIVCLALIGIAFENPKMRPLRAKPILIATFIALFLVAGFAFNGGAWRSPLTNLFGIAYFLEGGMYSGD